MPQGLIVKALSGFYYVLPSGIAYDGEALIQCRARGVFKKRGISPLVGDVVTFEQEASGEGTVTEISPRSAELIRPPIANVRLAVLVFSLNEPALSLQLLDKFLVHIEAAGLRSVICFTKQDLHTDEAEMERVTALYRGIGYEVVVTSSKLRKGVERIAEMLTDTISVFSGQSGVGKSSLLNEIVSGLSLQTNEISHKLGRGKHTTRHVELIPLEHGGFVADTPGFSQLDFANLEAQELGGCFKEFIPLSEQCKFRGCLHVHEPGCQVREALSQGDIAESRYEHYVHFLEEIKDRKRRY